MGKLGQPTFICLWLALVTLLAYLPVFQAQFVGCERTNRPYQLEASGWAFLFALIEDSRFYEMLVTGQTSGVEIGERSHRLNIGGRQSDAENHVFAE